MSDLHTDLLVLGGGITGLSAATYAQAAGIDVMVAERSREPGGMVRTIRKGGFQLELGANSAAWTPALADWVALLGMNDRCVWPTGAARHRFIARGGELHAVSPTPGFLLRTRLLRAGGKWRLLREPFVRAPGPEGETTAAFFTRRLGGEAYDYLVEPVLRGIYAGDPAQMDMEATLPQVLAWEREYGSLWRGLRASRGGATRRIVSFEGGMQALAWQAARLLGPRLHLGMEILAVRRLDRGGFEVQALRGSNLLTIRAARLIWTLPAHQHPLLQGCHPMLAATLAHISYVPVRMLYLGFRRADLPAMPEGFGFLVPRKESAHLMGAIWSGTIFPQQCAPDMQLFTLFVGGDAHSDGSAEAAQLFGRWMGIDAVPTFSYSHVWAQAIPLYERGHRQRCADMRAWQTPDCVFAGNFLDGVSVGACVEAGQATAAHMAD